MYTQGALGLQARYVTGQEGPSGGTGTSEGFTAAAGAFENNKLVTGSPALLQSLNITMSDAMNGTRHILLVDCNDLTDFTALGIGAAATLTSPPITVPGSLYVLAPGGGDHVDVRARKFLYKASGRGGTQRKGELMAIEEWVERVEGFPFNRGIAIFLSSTPTFTEVASADMRITCRYRKLLDCGEQWT